MTTHEKKLILCIPDVQFDFYESLKGIVLCRKEINLLKSEPLLGEISSINAHNETEKQIESLIQDFNYNIDYIDVHNRHMRSTPRSLEEYKKEHIDSLDLFVTKLFEVINQHKVTYEYMVSSGFVEEYNDNLNAVLNKTQTLENAQQSLNYWKDAIPEVVIEKSLISLAQQYIEDMHKKRELL